MAYEIDYIPVGEGEKSGDAIVLRFGNLAGTREEQTIIVIDGGFKESGEALVEHIKNYYKTEKVDLIVSTHPDADHASGLLVVMEKLSVGGLVMHKPWDHAQNIKSLFQNRRLTSSGLETILEKSLEHANELEALATKKGISIVEPFQGDHGYSDILKVLGPSKEYYEQLLPNFRTTPEPIKSVGLFAPVIKVAQEAAKSIQDFWHIDILDDDEDTTSAENNSSVIMLFNIDGQKLLFTGDAGKTALHLAADYALSQGIPLTDLHILDVPHHGSKRNLSSKVLSKIKAVNSFISAPKDSPKHPAKKITNALKKQDSRVYMTKGKGLCYPYDPATRPNWSAAVEEPFYDLVEE